MLELLAGVGVDTFNSTNKSETVAVKPGKRQY